ncbi:winged helix-turn-helix transcriptional regulator (plasmid) [Haloarcula sp. NS06]|uniref:winged helix-turn-helix transcriptional regulator n=1 Tax=Haloarcula sp. NS06 TaxID=3409688 RepID=UPI003DA78AAC
MPTESSCSASDAAELQELPPSAKLVAKTLEYEGKLTQSQLSESTLLPIRTVRSALRTLEENDIVIARISTMDARQQVYSLNIESN